MDRTDVTKKIVSAKVKKGMKWEAIAKKIGQSKEWVTAALLGQMQMTKKQAETAAAHQAWLRLAAHEDHMVGEEPSA